MDKKKKSNISNEKKSNDNQTEGYNPKRFTVIKLIYTILSILNVIVVIASYAKIGFALNDARIATECIGSINSKVISSNTHLLSIVIDVTNDNLSPEEKIVRLNNNRQAMWDIYAEVDKIKQEFDDIKRKDKKAKEKVDEAWERISEYRVMLEDFDADLSDPAAAQQFLANIYKKYDSVTPLMTETTAIIDEAAQIQKDASYAMFLTTAKSVVWILLMLILIFVVGFTSLHILQSSAKNAALELQKKKAEIEAFSKKLFTSREKTKVNSHTNPLTGLKNRHAMEEDLAVRLESENFHIVNFNYDRLCEFNENFGRDFGDEFLITIANKLTADYSKYAEIYNLSSDEFCFVFNSNITDEQADNLVKGITETMSAVYTIFNIAVQLTVSGCVCNYHAGDYMNLNSLFMKLDRAIREVKDDGGNMITTVNG